MRQSRSAVSVGGRWFLVLAVAIASWINPSRFARAFQAPAGAEPAPESAVADPSTRFRFVETYSAVDKPDPEVIGQYRVAVREKIKQMIEQDQGAPARTEESYQTIFTERPALVTEASGEVSDTVRLYEMFRKLPDHSRPSDPHPMEGLTLWFHSGAGQEPRILSLTEGRHLDESEYRIAAFQIFLPDLHGLLPSFPQRIGDDWRVSKAAQRALLGESSDRGPGLTAKLQSVRKGPMDRQLVAVISVTGRCFLQRRGNTAVNAEVQFTFTPHAEGAAEAPSGKPADAGGTVEARGAITKLSMALQSIMPASSNRDERRRRQVSREVILERRLADSGPPLMVPNPPPTPTEANSWLTADGPQGRFHFRYPQEFVHQPPMDAEDPVIVLSNQQGGTSDNLQFILWPKTGKTLEDRQNRDPEFHRKRLEQGWKEDQHEVIPGSAGWLPEADWAESKMKVYRLAVGLQHRGRNVRETQRIYFNFYLALLTNGDSLTLSALTIQDPPTAFQKHAEAILQTVRIGPAEPPKNSRAPAAPAAPPEPN